MTSGTASVAGYDISTNLRDVSYLFLIVMIHVLFLLAVEPLLKDTPEIIYTHIEIKTGF